MKTRVTLLSVVFVAGVSLISSAQLLTAPFKATPVGSSMALTKNDRLKASSVPVDLSLISIDQPFSRCGLTTLEKVSVTVKNVGTAKVGNFQIVYKVDGGTEVRETYADSLAAGAELKYNFTQTGNFETMKTYRIKAFTSYSSDNSNNANDTLSANVSNLKSLFLDSASIITGFEAADDPNAFPVKLDANADQVTWILNEMQQPKTGKFYCSGAIGTSMKADDWLFTPCLDLDTAVDYNLNFWFKGNSGTAITGKLEIMLGDKADPASMNKIVFRNESITGNNFREANETFRVTKPGGYVLGIHEYTVSSIAPPNGNVYLGVGIDDFKLTKKRKNSAVVAKVISPSTGCDLNKEPVVLSVFNNGIETITTMELSFKVGNTPAVKQTFIGPLVPGAFATFTFDSTANLSNGTTFNFSATTSLSLIGEERKSIVKEIQPQKFTTSATSLAIDFEDQTKLDGFEALDVNDDGKYWFVQFLQGQSFSGNSALTYPGFQPAEVDGDDWYFTKCLSLDKAKAYQVSFLMSTLTDNGGEPVPFEVYMGTAQSPSAMTLPLGQYKEDTGGSTPADYIEQLIDSIRVPATGIYYVGFYTNAPVGTGRLMIEDILIKRDKDPVGVDATEDLNYSVKVYPNPSSGIVNLFTDFTERTNVNVIVTDVMGKQILNNNYKGLVNDKITLNLNNQSNGVYSVTIQNENATTTRKVVLNK